MTRVHKWWRLALLAGGSLIAAQAGASFLARTRGGHAYLAAHLARAFGRTVEVRHFNILLLPRPVLDAEQVSIGEDSEFGNEYFLRAERLTGVLRWGGLVRGHVEFGTLSLSRPSLILVRNEGGEWNLERWLPPAKSTLGAGSRFYGPRPQQTLSNRLQKIDIDDGRINFKIGDEKLPFAFLGVSGSVEQVSSGRWRLQLESQPWRSGVTLQSAGTLLVSGDVAGTSARLQPAEIRVHWGKASLADLLRLLRGRDYGVRGVFALDGTAKSDANDRITAPGMQPGDWAFSLQARVGQIHRWDLSERADNPAANINLQGHWNRGMRNIFAERLAVETARSNLQGSARFASNTAPAWEIRVDSAGVQAADLLAWYRAFDANVNNAIGVDQFFTGAITLAGWPLRVDEAAFSSVGGEVRIPGLNGPLRIGAMEGGRQRTNLSVAPVRIVYPAPEPREGKTRTAPATAKRQNSADNAGAFEITFLHDFNKRAGSVKITGRIENVEEALKAMSALGRPVNRGWELSGPVTTALQYQWDNGAGTKGWSGHVDVNKGTLQVAGLNQPLLLGKVRLDWNGGMRSAVVTDAEAFGTTWSGQLQDTGIADATGSTKWNFQLHANHLEAADLDRWMGPRARPGWLQRLLPALLGGGGASNLAASELLRRVNAEGELRVDQFTMEKIELGQVWASGALHELHLEVRQADALCAGGRLRFKMRAGFLPRPFYDVTADLDRIDLHQVPGIGRFPDRFAGLASGTVHLTTQGVGRDELLQLLSGKGELRLRDVEFQGWDVNASMADGAPHEGASHWTSGEGTFQVRDRGIVFPGLRLESGTEMTLLKGTVNFARDSELSLQALFDDQTGMAPPEEGYVLKISGPLDVPRISIERLVARRPAD